MGADEAFLISDRKFAGVHSFVTSYVLGEAIKQLGDHALIFAGRRAIDDDHVYQGNRCLMRSVIGYFGLT